MVDGLRKYEARTLAFLAISAVAVVTFFLDIVLVAVVTVTVATILAQALV